MPSLAASKITPATLRRWPLPQPHPQGDKEDRGSVLVIAGSDEIAGAALLASTAALRAGAGKLTLAVPQSACGALGVALPEARVIGLPPTQDSGSMPDALGSAIDRSSAVLIGPGMQDEGATLRLAQAVLARVRHQAVVVDALALAVLAHAPALPWLLATPHAGEMAHLVGHTKEAVLSDPAAYACEAAVRWPACIALKGAQTWIAAPSAAPGAAAQPQLWRFDGGRPSLATSGSGDVLAGLAVGLAARGLGPVQTAAWVVFAHAEAGRRLEERHGGMGYLARELPDLIPSVLNAPVPAGRAPARASSPRQRREPP